MLCVVVHVHNPLNFDVVFPYGDPGEAKATTERVALLSLYNKEREQFEEAVEYKVYKARLRGLSRRDVGFKDGLQKHRLLLKLNRSSCVVLLTINSVDSYGRLEVDLHDPVQKFSYADWLLKKYPDVYYRYRTRSR